MSNSLQPHGLQHAGFPVLHYLAEFVQTHVHWFSDVILPFLPLSLLLLLFSIFPGGSRLRQLGHASTPFIWLPATCLESAGEVLNVQPQFSHFIKMTQNSFLMCRTNGLRLSSSFLFFGCLVACRFLVPWQAIEPRSSAVKVQSPNHWTAREFPRHSS